MTRKYLIGGNGLERHEICNSTGLKSGTARRRRRARFWVREIWDG
jgi:hypothetical protein